MFQGELKQPVSRLHGIGSKTAAVLSSNGIFTISDLLKHYPRDYEDRLKITGFAPALRGSEPYSVNTPALVTGHEYFGRPPKQTLKVQVIDQKGIPASLVCFGRNFLADKLKPETVILLYGTFQNRYNELQSSSFDFETVKPSDGTELSISDITPEIIKELSASFGKILPVYPLSAGLNQKVLRKAVAHALGEWAVNIETEIPEQLCSSFSVMKKPEALKQIHFPDSDEKRRLPSSALNSKSFSISSLLQPDDHSNEKT